MMRVILALLFCCLCCSTHGAEMLTEVVLQDPDLSPVFHGELISLNCVLSSELNGRQWRYIWYIDGHPVTQWSMKTTVNVEAGHNHSNYECAVAPQQGYSEQHRSEPYKLLVLEIPHAAITIQSPQPPFHSGDSVTLRCEVQGNGWEYTWIKNKRLIDVTSQTITVSLPEDAGHYECHGIRRGLPSYNSQSSIISIATLPKPSLTPDPQDPVSTEETDTSGSNQGLVGVAVVGGLVGGVALTILIVKILLHYCRKQRGPVSNSSPVAVGQADNSNHEHNDQGLPIYETIQHVAPTRKVMDTVYDKLSLSNMDPSALSNPYELAE